jgi:hypothetical protein
MGEKEYVWEVKYISALKKAASSEESSLGHNLLGRPVKDYLDDENYLQVMSSKALASAMYIVAYTPEEACAKFHSLGINTYREPISVQRLMEISVK